MSGIGHNQPEGVEALQVELEHLQERVAHWSGQEITAESAPLLRQDIDTASKAAKRAYEMKRAAKAPHEAAAKAEELRFAPFEQALKLAADRLKGALAVFLREEESRRLAIAREAALKAEAERAAAEEARRAAQTTQDPFAAFDAEEEARRREAEIEVARRAQAEAQRRLNVAGADGARALGLRSVWSVRLVDPAALVAHYAARSAVIDAALAIATAEMRASKGHAEIPGVEAVEDRRVG